MLQMQPVEQLQLHGEGVRVGVRVGGWVGGMGSASSVTGWWWWR